MCQIFGDKTMGSLVDSVTSAYNTWKSGKDLSTMNESELNQYNITDIKFQKALTDATELETKFYLARDEAFSALETSYQTQRATLASTWQNYENNAFTIPE